MMRFHRTVWALLLLASFGVVTAAHAATAVASNSYSLPSGTTIFGNLYAAGKDATVSGHVTGEAAIAGGSATVSGPVDQSVSVVGGKVTINAPIGGNLHVLGGNVTINSSIKGDVLVAGGTVDISAGGTVGGDAIVAAGKLTLSGKVNGDLRVAAGTVSIEGAVGRSVFARSGKTSLSESATIGGDFDYHSPNRAAISPAAKIGGATNYTHSGSSNYGSFSALGLLFRLILLYVASLVLIALFRNQSKAVTETFDRRFFPALFLGFGFIILAPFVGILLLLSIVGVYLAIILFLAYLLLILLAIAYGSIGLGHVIVKRFGDGPMSPYLSSLIGVALVVLLTTIPIIGGIAGFVLAVAGTGSLLLCLTGRGAAQIPLLTSSEDPNRSTPRRRTKKAPTRSRK
jgi:cytoskeletal protein CcmA (bactofilin family)